MRTNERKNLNKFWKSIKHHDDIRKKRCRQPNGMDQSTNILHLLNTTNKEATGPESVSVGQYETEYATT